jgi:hypothetical protein
MKDEALKLALEALEAATRYGAGGFENAKDALREAQAAQLLAVQEPMETYIHHCRYQPHPNDFGIPKGHWWQAKQYADAVNTTPPAAQRQWVGLTEDERDTILRSESSIFEMTEAILKAKNT